MTLPFAPGFASAILAIAGVHAETVAPLNEARAPFAKRGYVDHTYYDHASVLKFIEHNWRLAPLSKESRDNLPNPEMTGADRYLPANRPAVGDLLNLFQI